MATSKERVSFYADPYVSQWLNSLPALSRSEHINRVITSALLKEGFSSETDEVSPPVDTPISKKVELPKSASNKRLPELQHSRQATIHPDTTFDPVAFENLEYQVYDLNNWRDTLPGLEIFQELEVGDVRDIFGVLIDLVPELKTLSERVKDLEKHAGLTKEGKKPIG